MFSIVAMVGAAALCCIVAEASGASQAPLDVSSVLYDGAPGRARAEHPLYPNHRVRTTESRFCDGGVRCVPPRTSASTSSGADGGGRRAARTRATSTAARGTSSSTSSRAGARRRRTTSCSGSTAGPAGPRPSGCSWSSVRASADFRRGVPGREGGVSGFKLRVLEPSFLPCRGGAGLVD